MFTRSAMTYSCALTPGIPVYTFCWEINLEKQMHNALHADSKSFLHIEHY